MREKLIQYVNLLFAGAPDSEDMRTEILQNTLDRYDDLIAQGKAPEAAYRLAISGIGDINEILSVGTQPSAAVQPQNTATVHEDANEKDQKKIRATAIALYIVSALPLIVLSDFGFDTLGLVLTVALVAVATYLIIISSKKETDDEEDMKEIKSASPQQELKTTLVSSFLPLPWLYSSS